MTGQAVGAAVQLGVGEGDFVGLDGNGVGGTGDLGGEQVGERRRRYRRTGVLPRGEGPALVGGEQVDPADRALRGLDDRLQQGDQPRADGRHGGAVEQVGPVVEREP